MGLYSWDQSFSVGVQLFDDHHKKLFDIINDLADTILDGSEHDKVVKNLEELLHYTKYHFREEEKQLEKLPDYPDLPKHKEMHRMFEEKIAGARDAIKDGEDVRAVNTAFLASVSWLQNHIKTVDKKYEPLMHAQGIR